MYLITLCEIDPEAKSLFLDDGGFIPILANSNLSKKVGCYAS